MPRFFKRSAKVPITNSEQNDNDNSETCAIDTYRVRSSDQPLDIDNQNRLIENELNADRLTGSTATVSERVSNFVNGIIAKMGKNWRKNKINQQPIQQQQPQSHLKKVLVQSDKQQQHGKIRQPTIKKAQHNEFYPNETTTACNKSAPVSFDVNIKSERTLCGDGYDEKVQRKMHDNKNNIKNHQNAPNIHSDTFNTNESQRVIRLDRIGSMPNHMSARNCIGTNAADNEAKSRNQVNAVQLNVIDKALGPNDRIIKNSLFAEETATLHSHIEIESSISDANHLDRSECKQLTPQSNKHISSSADANNNEVNIVVENGGGVQSNVTVNCHPVNSNAHSVRQQEERRSLDKPSAIPSQTVHKIEIEIETRSKQAISESSIGQNTPCDKNITKTMGQHQSTNTADRSGPKQHKTNYTQCKNESTENIATKQTANCWHDAAAPAPVPSLYEKNKINFSNEINEILETETSSKQSCAQPDQEAEAIEAHSVAATSTVSNEIKDIFYETSSGLSGEITTGKFVGSNGESVTTPQHTGTVTENVNGTVPRFESASNGTQNSQKTDTKIPLKNDKVDVTSTTECDTVAAANVPSRENDTERRVKNEQYQNSSTGANKIQNQRVSESECGADNCKPSNIKLKENRAQMEQNVLYRVDSYNSDDHLELSDIEETVIDQNGRVIEVKTLFKQRSANKTSTNELQFKRSVDSAIDGIRTISGRRRSNSISGSLGIEIVEVGANTAHTDYLTQQPFVSFSDDSSAIKLSDLRDNNKAVEKENNCAIDIVEMVEESESESEIEEDTDEVDEDVDDEEEEEELVSANGSISDSTAEDIVNGSTQNAFNSKVSGLSNGSVQSAQTAAPHTRTNYQNNDNDVNGQPTRFSANTINLSKNTETLSHSHSRVNEHELNSSSHIDKSQKVVRNNSSSNLREKSFESKQHPPKYSDDAMHLPDIVVGSTLLGSNVNSGVKRPIALSRSPPKIVVNDNTLDSWTSNEDETDTISDSFDESIEIDDTSELTDDEKAHKNQNDKLLSPSLLNVTNTELNECQDNEAKQHELNLIAQLNEANKNVAGCQAKIDEMTYKISELERDVTVKSWSIERVQAELESAYKELSLVKMKLKLQEAELDSVRSSNCEKEDDQNIRYNNLEADHLELKQKLDQMQALAISLQVQLSTAQTHLADLRAEKEKLIGERNVERQALQDALDAAIIERAENDAKWQRDFEQLRTLNSDREELLLQDCEWKIRATERTCKDRINAAEQVKKDALKKSEQLAADSQDQIEKVKHLKLAEAELAAVRGLSNFGCSNEVWHRYKSKIYCTHIDWLELIPVQVGQRC